MDHEPLEHEDFPVDDATLVMLAEACRVNEESGRSHLNDFLFMGSVEASRELLEEADEELAGMAGAPVFLVEYEPGRAPFSPNGVILALIAEIQRLRSEGG